MPGKTSTIIVVSPGAGANEKQAASDLARYVGLMCGTKPAIANTDAAADTWKRTKLDNIALMLQSCLAAESRVGLMMNVRRGDLQKVLDQLPALQQPTVSSLSDPEWIAVNTILESTVVRVIVPQLKSLGACGIVEYPINKIID